MAIHGDLDPQRTHYLDRQLWQRTHEADAVGTPSGNETERSASSPLTVRVASEETRSAVNLISPACSGLTDLKHSVCVLPAATSKHQKVSSL